MNLNNEVSVVSHCSFLWNPACPLPLLVPAKHHRCVARCQADQQMCPRTGTQILSAVVSLLLGNEWYDWLDHFCSCPVEIHPSSVSHLQMPVWDLLSPGR